VAAGRVEAKQGNVCSRWVKEHPHSVAPAPTSCAIRHGFQSPAGISRFHYPTQPPSSGVLLRTHAALTHGAFSARDLRSCPRALFMQAMQSTSGPRASHSGRMKKVCAWCERESGRRATGVVSHGICRRHATALLGELGVKMQRDGNGVAQPVEVV